VQNILLLRTVLEMSSFVVELAVTGYQKFAACSHMEGIIYGFVISFRAYRLYKADTTGSLFRLRQQKSALKTKIKIHYSTLLIKPSFMDLSVTKVNPPSAAGGGE